MAASPHSLSLPSQTGSVRCLTIDVEEYFHIEAAYGHVTSQHTMPRRAQASMDRLLELFDQYDVQATLFFLADIAKAHPELVKRCHQAGHEIASHGSGHDRLHRLSPAKFRQTLEDSRQHLEDLIGEPVIGYRAPTWSVTRDTAWAVDVLFEAGFVYDASVFPVSHPQYGVSDAPVSPFYLKGDPQGQTLLEVPPLVYRLAGRHVACAGGGWFRLLPLSLMRMGLDQAERDGRPAVLYFHPWEFDPEIPRLPLGLVGRVRTYTGLRSAHDRLAKILREYDRWQTMRDSLMHFREQAQRSDPYCLTQAA